MNQFRTTYQSDFTPFDWLQNNVISDMDEFCSSENVDECLKYISQEFSALGFPSIYTESNDSPFSANCDIVKFLNATHELLRSNNEYIQKNEDLESRNQCLYSDLSSLNKKNSALKAALEQNERKLTSALERERQLKEKNELLLQQLKVEKEETKKISLQLHQKKVTYQHDIRKYENNLNQMKVKISQLLSDKNPNKKIATMTSSHALPRNSGQRGKWKTGTTASTAVEEMHNAVISMYENRTKELCTELNLFRQCLQSVILEIVEIVSLLQGEIGNNGASMTAEEFVLNDMKKDCWDISNFEARFKYLFQILKENALEKIHTMKKNLEGQITDLKLKLSTKEKVNSQQVINSCSLTTSENNENSAELLAKESIKQEKMKIEAEKLALSKSFKDIEKEKAEIAVQKIALLRLAIQQKVPTSSSWHESIKTFPSVSVITSQSGSRSISDLHSLKSSLSMSEQIGQSDRSFSPQWISDELVNNAKFCRKSDTALPRKTMSASQSFAGSPVPEEIKSPCSDLPSWAVDKTESQFDVPSPILIVSQSVASKEELHSEPSSEDISMLRLKAAVEDIERRRANTP